MLLATDLDGTFLAGDYACRRQLYQLVQAHPDIQLVFVTGRGLESVMPLLSDPLIPRPDYLICDVGATVVDGEKLQSFQPLQAEIDARWPGEPVIAEAMQVFPELQRQDVPQRRRCSYFGKPEAISQHINTIAAKLDCDVIYSADWYLDIMPQGVNKGSSLRRLIELLDVDPQQVLVAGDTLNDLSMFEQGFNGVCVGQSETALLRQTEKLSTVFHANEPGCGGILESLRHFGFLGDHGLAAEIPQPVETGSAATVIVYHRLPYEERYENGQMRRGAPRSPNGIIPTLLGFFGQQRQGAWIAWAIHEDENPEIFESHTAVDLHNYPNLLCARVPLTTQQVDIFYKRFSKEAFWPMLHTFWERATFNEQHWQVFLDVNRRFAETAAAEAAPGALVWLHDYNLWMVPAFLREMRPDLIIAFFHHTHFPSADVFNVVPWRREIISSLLQCDYIGFHIPRQVENFVDVARGVTPIQIVETMSCAPRFLTYGCALGLETMSRVINANGRQVTLGALPVGLDMSRVENTLNRADVQQRIQVLRQELAGQQVILSVERLDYTKGSLEKLLAFERLLEQHKELCGKVSLLTVCVPAAKEMQIYDELQIQIEQVVGRINGRFAQVGWTPVKFFFRPFPFEEVIALYALANVMWVTPLRDGLNLVAKEFVAVQGLIQHSGVLVLSEFAGAAVELRGALLTNPFDANDLVETCYRALTLAEPEATSRMRELFHIVSHYDIRYWSDVFLAEVEAIQAARPATEARH